jgi:hypothetical protein
MTITDTPMLRRIEEALAKTGRRKKKTSYDPTTPTAKALRESGISEQDVQMLIEGTQHEADYIRGTEGAARHRSEIPAAVDRALRVFQETTGDGAAPDAGSMPEMAPPTSYGWKKTTATTAAHEGKGHVMHVTGGAWVRRDSATGKILASGRGAKSVGEHVKEVDGLGDTENAAESLTNILNRVRGLRPPVAVPAGTHQRLAEAFTRTVRSAPTTGGDLHTRLRAAVVRP